MTKKIAELPKASQNVLSIASCIGNRFDLKTLAQASHYSLEDTANYLWPVLKEGLIIPNDDNYKFVDNHMHSDITYHFLHDRVQQAVYTSIPTQTRESIHYQISKIFIGKGAEFITTHLFNIVNQINLGNRLVTTNYEKSTSAELNYRAGMKAKNSSSFTSAVNYFQNGINILSKDHWEQCYSLSFQLYQQFAECLHIIGDHHHAVNIAKIALDKASTNLEKASIIPILYDSYSSFGDF